MAHISVCHNQQLLFISVPPSKSSGQSLKYYPWVIEETAVVLKSMVDLVILYNSVVDFSSEITLAFLQSVLVI